MILGCSVDLASLSDIASRTPGIPRCARKKETCHVISETEILDEKAREDYFIVSEESQAAGGLSRPTVYSQKPREGGGKPRTSRPRPHHKGTTTSFRSSACAHTDLHLRTPFSLPGPGSPAFGQVCLPCAVLSLIHVALLGKSLGLWTMVRAGASTEWNSTGFQRWQMRRFAFGTFNA